MRTIESLIAGSNQRKRRRPGSRGRHRWCPLPWQTTAGPAAATMRRDHPRRSRTRPAEPERPQGRTHPRWLSTSSTATTLMIETCSDVAMLLELHERAGNFTIVAGPDRDPIPHDVTADAAVRIDVAWATQILSGAMSPLAGLERRLGSPTRLFEDVRAIVGAGRLRRLGSRVAGPAVMTPPRG